MTPAGSRLVEMESICRMQKVVNMVEKVDISLVVRSAGSRK